MKSLLIAALSLSALAPSHDADACGGYTPEARVLRLSTHVIVGEQAAERRRSFVLLGTATPPAQAAWRQLSPMSYDPTHIASGRTLANPLTYTLVGPSGTRVVASSKHVFLSKSWQFRQPTSAIEVGDGEGFVIALEGAHAGAQWVALEDARSSRQLEAWVAALGVTAAGGNSIWVNRLAGTDVETVSVYPKGGKQVITFVKRGDRNLGRFDGGALGAITKDGVTQVVIADGAFVSTAHLW